MDNEKQTSMDLTEDLLIDVGSKLRDMDPGSKEYADTAQMYKSLFTAYNEGRANAFKVDNDLYINEKKVDNDHTINLAKIDIEKEKISLEDRKLKAQMELDKQRLDFEKEKFELDKTKAERDWLVNQHKAQMDLKTLESEEKRAKKERRSNGFFKGAELVLKLAFGLGLAYLHITDWSNNQRDILTNPESKDFDKRIKGKFMDYIGK